MNDLSDLLTIEEAAIFLNVSETSLRRWTNDGSLACARIGQKRIRRFKRSDLIAFLNLDSQPSAASQKQTLIGGIAVAHGSHLCSFYTSEAGRTKLTIEFIADGLQQECACHIVCTPQAFQDILTQLHHYRPDFKKDIASGRLSMSEYSKTPEEQLKKLEETCKAALKDGAKTIRLVGNVTDSVMAKTKPFETLRRYEEDLDSVVKKYPLVLLCQYDATRHKGPEIVEILKCHRDVFSYPADRLLH